MLLLTCGFDVNCISLRQKNAVAVVSFNGQRLRDVFAKDEGTLPLAPAEQELCAGRGGMGLGGWGGHALVGPLEGEIGGIAVSQEGPTVQSSGMAAEAKDGGGQFKRFSGADLDGKAYRQWKLWAKAKLASMKDVQKTQRGPLRVLLTGWAGSGER
eukprot:s2127_g1.t1